jgi:hypothetical protein
MNNKQYNIHTIDSKNYDNYHPILEQLNICSPEFISKNYEFLSYDALSEPEYIGFLLSDVANSIIYSSLIVDLMCEQLINKINDPTLIENAVCIGMVCSNVATRVPKLTSGFVEYVMKQLIPTYKPNVSHILLYVAKESKNTRAIDFYKKLGFHFVWNYIMSAPIKGGRKSKKHNFIKKHRRTKKNKKTKNKRSKKNNLILKILK